MVYAYDQWALMPVKDLYDTLIMLAAVNAAKDMYEKSKKDLDDFYKQNQDFYSPFAEDINTYNNLTINGISKKLDDMRARGIDPLRSSEGRVELRRYIYGVPTGTLAALKANAKSGEKYLDAVAALKAAGKYDKELEDFDIAMNGGTSFDNFSTIDPKTGNVRMWGRRAPIEAKTLQEVVHPLFANIKPHMLDKDDVESREYRYDPNYDYEGVVRSDMEQSMRDFMPGVQGSPYYQFYRNKAAEDVARKGLPLTNENIDNQFIENAINSDAQMMTPLKREANPFKLDAYRTANDIRAHSQNAATDHYYTMLENGADVDGDGKISASEARAFAASGGKGGGKKDTTRNIFREADSNPNSNVDYVTSEAYYQKIDPVKRGIRQIHDKDAGDAYVIPAKDFNGTLYKSVTTKVETRNGKSFIKEEKVPFNLQEPKGSYYFKPTGSLRKVGTKYYITGTLLDNISGKSRIDDDGSLMLFEMEVKERGYNYGSKQKSAY